MWRLCLIGAAIEFQSLSPLLYLISWKEEVTMEAVASQKGSAHPLQWLRISSYSPKSSLYSCPFGR